MRQRNALASFFLSVHSASWNWIRVRVCGSVLLQIVQTRSLTITEKLPNFFLKYAWFRRSHQGAPGSRIRSGLPHSLVPICSRNVRTIVLTKHFIQFETWLRVGKVDQLPTSGPRTKCTAFVGRAIHSSQLAGEGHVDRVKKSLCCGALTKYHLKYYLWADAVSPHHFIPSSPHVSAYYGSPLHST